MRVAAAHVLQHEQVEADRRRDLRHLDQDDEIDAEPDQVEAGLLAPSAARSRAVQHDHRDAVEEAAEDDVDARSARAIEHVRARDAGPRPSRPVPRDAGVGHRRRGEGGAGEDQHDHAGRAASRPCTLSRKRRPASASRLHQASDQRADDAPGRAFGRGREAEDRATGSTAAISSRHGISLADSPQLLRERSSAGRAAASFSGLSSAQTTM